MSYITPKVQSLVDRFEVLKNSREIWEEGDKCWDLPDGHDSLQTIEEDMAYELREWEELEPQNRETKANRDEIVSLRARIEDWKKGVLSGEVRRWTTGRELIEVGGIPVVVLAQMMREKSYASIQAWRPISGNSVVALESPEVPSGYDAISFMIPEEETAYSSWLQELYGLIFDLEQVLLCLPTERLPNGSIRHIPAMHGDEAWTAFGLGGQRQALGGDERRMEGQLRDKATGVNAEAVYVPPALFKDRSPAVARDAMRKDYADSIIAHVLHKEMDIRKTEIGRLLYADANERTGRTLRNRVGGLLDQAGRGPIIIGDDPKD